MTTSAAGRALTRRQFNRLVAVAGLSAGVSPMLPGSASAAPNVTVFEWAGYEAENLHTEFSQKHGGSPSFSLYSEEEEAFQKLKSGFKVDLSHPCTLSLRRWRDAGLIKPIDTSRIPRWKDIPAAMLDFQGIKFEDKYWMVPMDWGNSTVLYREDELPDAQQSYKLLLEDRLKGRVSIIDSVDEVFCFAAGVVGLKSHLNLTDDEIKACTDVLRALNKQIRFFWPDATTLQQALVSKEVVAAWAWTDTYFTLKGQGEPIKFMFPEEGLSSWVCGLAMNVGGAGDEAQVYDYLNAILSPETGKILIDDWGYGHANGESYKLATSELAKGLGITGDVKKFIEGTRFQGEIEPQTREKMIKVWDEVKLGG
jgi:spermidine/putrescine-binding protein